MPGLPLFLHTAAPVPPGPHGPRPIGILTVQVEDAVGVMTVIAGPTGYIGTRTPVSAQLLRRASCTASVITAHQVLGAIQRRPGICALTSARVLPTSHVTRRSSPAGSSTPRTRPGAAVTARTAPTATPTRRIAPHDDC